MERTRDTDWTLNPVDWVALVLLLIGGLNWGLMGLFSFDLVARLFGDLTIITRIVYLLVGISALWSIFALTTHLHQRPHEIRQTPGAVTH
jgi:uncharacterized protein